MGRILALAPELGTLGHAEAVLLVDHHHAQPGKADGILDDGMRTHQDVYRTIRQPVQHLLPAPPLDDAREQCHTDGHVVQKVHDGLQVLLGQYLRRGHDAGLVAVVQRNEHRHQCHQRLAAAHVALQQAVHLAPAAHVPADFADDALLGIGQREGQVAVVETVEQVAHPPEDVAAELAALVARIP